MAGCCISRILYSVLFGLLLVCGVTYASSQTAEQIEEVELITVPKPGQEFVVLHTPVAGTSNTDTDLKKYSISKKVSKSRGKSELESNAKENGKRNTDILIKDAKDPRLLRIISEAGLLTPQDVLPLSDTLSSHNQENNEEENMSVSVEPEGMTGILNGALNVDSDEQKILERKKESISEKENTSEEFSNESRENVNIKLDSSTGVQKHNLINDQDNTGVPAQKQLSLKEKDNYRPKKATEEEAYQRNVKKEDEGNFDFVDPTLLDKHLVPAASAQNSRINVKKGPNGQDYEYEYIYYYYEDDDSPAGNAVVADSPQKDQKQIVQQKPTSTLRPTTTSSPKYVQVTTEQDIRTKAPSHEHDRNQLRQRGSLAEQGTRISQPYPEIPSTQYREPVSNEIYQYHPPNSRYPGRQFPVTSSEEHSIPIETQQRIAQNTRMPQRGRSHNFDAIAKTEPTVTVAQNKEIVTTKNKAASGVPRQQGLDLVDNLSFQTYSSNNIPTSRQQPQQSQQPQQVLPTQRFAVDRIPDEPKSKAINTGSIENSFSTSKAAPSKTDVVKEITSEYVTETNLPVTYTRTISTSDTNSPSTIPLSTLSDNSLTTIYGAGLTDKAAHDLYAIYQQARAEETDLQDTTIITEDTSSESTHFIPTTTVYTTTTTPTPTTTVTTTTTTTTTTPPPTLPPTGKGRYRGNNKNKFLHSTTTTTESASESSTSEKTRKFQPSNRKNNGERVPSFGRRGQTSSTVSASTSADTTNAPQAESTKPNWLSPTRSRYRTGSSRSESTSTEVPTTGAHVKPNFADRYNTRRRKGSSTTVATDVVSETQEINQSDVSSSEVPTSTIKSLRGRLNTNSPIRPLRPGARLNLPGRNRVQTTSSTEVSEIDTDASGSADVPVEQRETDVAAAAGQAENESDTTVPTVSSTTTPVPDTLTRLRNRQKLRVSDKSKETKQIQNQANAANLNQNRRTLVSNLLPRKRNQQSTPSESLEKEEKIEKSESEVKPVTEDIAEDVPKQSDDVDSSSVSEVPSTTESKLSSLVASRRRNLASRRPGSLTRPQKQEDSNNEN